MDDERSAEQSDGGLVDAGTEGAGGRQVIPLWAAAEVEAAGAKAQVLSRALRAGLAVPDGLVALPDEEIDEPALALALRRLGAQRFAVRSSANLEDRPGLSAAGIYASIVEVAPESVAGAIASVREARFGGAARAYLGARGLSLGAVRMAVLVQPMVRGRLGVLHTAPIVDGALCAEERDEGEPEWGQVSPVRVALDSPLATGALAMARLVGGPADVEYAHGPNGVVFLQARPLAGTPPPARDPARFALPTSDAAGREWLRDAEHNPEPLSAAQVSLVERLNRAPCALSQRVVGGYLYFEARSASGSPTVVAAVDLPAHFAAVVEPACDALLLPLERRGADPSALDEALEVYGAVVSRYVAEVSPSIAAARRALDALLQRNIGEGLSQHAGLLAGTGGRTLARDSALRAIGVAGDDTQRSALLQAYRERFGAYAPAWDIAVAPDDEAEDRVLAAGAVLARGAAPEARHRDALASAEAAARRVTDRLPSSERAAFWSVLPTVRAALEIAEDDDVIFFRAQRAVRRPLLARGRAAAAAGDLVAAWQIFDLPIEAVQAGAIDMGRAYAHRAMREAAARSVPPTAIRDGVCTWRGGGTSAILFGAGTGGRAFGRAFVVAAPGAGAEPMPLPPAGCVLVIGAMLPSLTWLIPTSAALVTDWGGALSHGATLAREYGVPAVLGTGDATARLRTGEELLVDADAGRIYRLGSW